MPELAAAWAETLTEAVFSAAVAAQPQAMGDSLVYRGQSAQSFPSSEKSISVDVPSTAEACRPLLWEGV